MKKRTGWRGQSESQIEGEEKRNGRLVRAAETSKDRAGWRRLQRKYLSILGLSKKKGGLDATERAVGKYARAAFAKRERNKAICPEHQIVRRAFSVREVKRTAAKERKRDEYSSAEGQQESK